MTASLPKPSARPCYQALGEPFGLSAHSWDTLLHLDAEENQVLTRPGAVPAAADLVALYNFHALDTCLRRAAKIVLNGLSLTAAEAADVRALARALGVKAVLSGDGATVTLSDQSSPACCRAVRGGSPGACCIWSTTFATRATTGHVETHLGTRLFRLALGTDTFKALGAPLSPKSLRLSFRRRIEAGRCALLKAWSSCGHRAGAAGWRIKRQPDPIVSAHGVFLPDLTLTQSTAVPASSSAVRRAATGTVPSSPCLWSGKSRRPRRRARPRGSRHAESVRPARRPGTRRPR